MNNVVQFQRSGVFNFEWILSFNGYPREPSLYRRTHKKWTYMYIIMPLYPHIMFLKDVPRPRIWVLWLVAEEKKL